MDKATHATGRSTDAAKERKQPNQFGYEYDLLLSECTQRFNYDMKGGLLIEPPEGKKVGITLGNAILAAPDMLKALKGLLPWLERKGMDDWAHRYAHQVRSAISKAEGRN